MSAALSSVLFLEAELGDMSFVMSLSNDFAVGVEGVGVVTVVFVVGVHIVEGIGDTVVVEEVVVVVVVVVLLGGV